MSYQTIQVRFQEKICFLQLHRPEANNTINQRLVQECQQVLSLCEESCTILVLEGLPEVFCLGADFQNIHAMRADGEQDQQGPDPLYDLWMKMAAGPFISLAHVRGKANAGGIGFVAACDIVLADQTAQFSLSELLFGLLPACVLPFLVRRIGFQKAQYLTLMTKPIPVEQAQSWGLVDVSAADSTSLVRQHLLRLRHLSKPAIQRYKQYMNELDGTLQQVKALAVSTNREIFGDPQILQNISRYVQTGQFPWEARP